MPDKQLRRQIRNAYKQDELTHILTLPEADFGATLGMETVQIDRGTGQYGWTPRGGEPQDYYHFRDNGSTVLAVAHLDTVVQPECRKARFTNTGNGQMVVSGSLDDRLGAYAITRLLPAMGIQHDWLFTVGEESGMSTAEYFKPEKQYDWLIEFDRGGTDVVMYQYEDDECCDLVYEAGARMGSGSFSDVAFMEDLGVKGFNWGVGYQGNYHSEKGFAYLNDTFSMVAKYLRFHELNKGTALSHEPEKYGRVEKYDESWLDCTMCGKEGTVDTYDMYCFWCDSCNDCERKKADCQCYTPEIKVSLRTIGYIQHIFSRMCPLARKGWKGNK